MNEAPLSYGEVRDIYDQLKGTNPTLAELSLPEFSQLATRATGKDIFAAGMNDNLLKRASNVFDKALRPISQYTGAATELGAEALGLGEYSDLAHNIGEGLPRGLIEMFPMFRGAGLLNRAMQAASVGSVAANTYTQTDSLRAGAIAGALHGAFPSMVRAGEKLAIRPVQKLFWEQTEMLPGVAKTAATVPGSSNPLLPFAERTAEFVGRNVAGAVNQELAIQGTTLATTGRPAAFNEQHAAELIGSQLPFSVLEAVGVVRPRFRNEPLSAARTRAAGEVAKAAEETMRHVDTKQREIDNKVASESKSVEDYLKSIEDVAQRTSAVRSYAITRSAVTKEILRAQVEGKPFSFDNVLKQGQWGVTDKRMLGMIMDDLTSRPEGQRLLVPNEDGTFTVDKGLNVDNIIRRRAGTQQEMPMNATIRITGEGGVELPPMEETAMFGRLGLKRGSVVSELFNMSPERWARPHPRVLEILEDPQTWAGRQEELYAWLYWNETKGSTEKRRATAVVEGSTPVLGPQLTLEKVTTKGEARRFLDQQYVQLRNKARRSKTEVVQGTHSVFGPGYYLRSDLGTGVKGETAIKAVGEVGSAKQVWVNNKPTDMLAVEVKTDKGTSTQYRQADPLEVKMLPEKPQLTKAIVEERSAAARKKNFEIDEQLRLEYNAEVEKTIKKVGAKSEYDLIEYSPEYNYEQTAFSRQEQAVERKMNALNALLDFVPDEGRRLEIRRALSGENPMPTTRLTTSDEIAFLHTQGEILRGRIQASGGEKVQQLLSIVDEQFNKAISALNVEDNHEYPGSMLVEKYANILARRTQQMQELMGELDNYYRHILEAKWEEKLVSEEYKLQQQAEKDKGLLPKTVEEGDARAKGITPMAEAALFERLSAFEQDPEMKPLFSELERLLYRIQQDRTIRGTTRRGQMAAMATGYAMYEAFDRAALLMKGLDDTKKGVASAAAAEWGKIRNDVSLKKLVDDGVEITPVDVFRVGLKSKAEKGATYYDNLYEDSIHAMLEGGEELGPDELPAVRAHVVEKFLDEQEMERIGALLSGEHRRIAEGTEMKEVSRRVIEMLPNLKFEEGKLKNLVFAAIRFGPDGKVDWERSGKVGQVERERATTSGASMASVLARTAQVLQAPEKFGVRIEATTAGDFTIGVDSSKQLGGLTTKLKERVLRYVGAFSKEQQKIHDALYGVGENGEANVETLRRLIWEEHTGLAKRADEGDVEAEEKLEAMFRKEYEKGRKMYADAIDNGFRVWARGTAAKPGFAIRVLQAAQGEVLKTLKKSQQATLGEFSEGVRRAATVDRIVVGADNADPLAVGAATQAFYQTQFEKLGYSPSDATTLANAAGRIALNFRRLTKNGKLGELDSTDNAAGAAWSRDPNVPPVLAFMAVHSEFYQKLPFRSQKTFVLLKVLGHEFGHVLLNKSRLMTDERSMAVREAFKQAVALGEDKRRVVLSDLMDVVVPKDRKSGLQEYLTHRGRIAGGDVDEFFADYIGLKMLGLVSPAPDSIFGDGYVPGPDYLAHFDRSLYATISDAIHAMKNDPESNRLYGESLLEVDRKINSAIENQKAVDAIGKKLFALANESPMAYADLVGQAFVPGVLNQRTRVLGYVKDEGEAQFASTAMGRNTPNVVGKYLGVAPGFVERNFMLPALLAQRYPVLRPAIDVVFRFRALANSLAHNIALPMLRTKKVAGLLPVGDMLDVEATGIKFLSRNKLAHDVASVIAILKQEQVDADGKIVQGGRVMSDAEMRQIASDHGLTDPKAQQHVIDFHRNYEKVSPRMRQAIIDSMLELGSYRLAGKLMNSDPALSHMAAKERAKALFAEVVRLSRGEAPITDIAAMVGGDRALMNTVGEALKYATSIEEFAKRTADNDWFMPEVRLGKYVVVWRDKATKKNGSLAFDTKEELAAKLQRLEADPNVVNIRAWDKWEHNREYAGLSPSFIKLLQEIERSALMKAQIEGGWTSEQARDFGYVPLAATMRQVEDTSASRFLRQRNQAPGREELDMVRGALVGITTVSNALAKELTKAEIGLAMSDPSIRGNDIALNMARDHFNTVVNPSAKEFSSLKKLNFAYFMGFNLSSMLIEPTQALIALAPTLTRDSGSVGSGLKSIGLAGKLIARAALMKGQNLAKRIGKFDPELARWLEKANAEQTLDFGVMQEFYAAGDEAVLNLNSMLHGGLVNKVGQVAKGALNSYVELTRTIYGQVPKLNNLLAYISAFDQARRVGVLKEGKLTKLSGQEAHDYATLTTRATMYGGGSAARPIGMFARSGKFQGVVGLSYSLATYTFGVLSHFARLAADSIDRRGKLSVGERRAARKALGQSMATQMALAGALGMPGVGAAMAVVKQVFGINPRKAVEDGLRQLFDEDEETGGFWTDLALRGAPFVTAGGVDLSSRLAISQVLGVSPYDGFRLANLFGPTGSIVENAAKATQQVTQGLVGDAAETLAPTAIKNVVKLWRDGWAVRDTNGKLIMEPSGWQLALDGMGLRPAELTKRRDALQMLRHSEDTAAREQSQFYRRMAQRLLAGDASEVREELFNRQQAVEGFSAVAGAQAVAAAALDLMLPYDPAREGTSSNASTRQRLARQGGFKRTREIDRLMTKKRLEAELGVPGAGEVSNTQLSATLMVDQLLDANPFMSRQEAVAMVGGQPF